MKRRTFLSLMGAAALTSSMMLTGCGAGSGDNRKIEDIDPVIFYGVNNVNMKMIQALYPKLKISGTWK